MNTRVAAIVMAAAAAFFAFGAIVFASAQQRQSETRDALVERGVQVPLESRTFLEKDTASVNPNTGVTDRYSDDQVLFSFVLPDGGDVTVAQPMSADRYAELGPISTLSAVFLAEEPESAELLDNGEFAANLIPYTLFALLCGVLALGSAASALSTFRKTARVSDDGD